MKSLFKRTIAAASSSVLVLSQVATLAANVNVSAATTPLIIDKEFVLDVPVDANDPLKADQHSDWNNEAEALLLELGDKDIEVSTAKIKEVSRKYANKFAAKYGHISSVEIDELLATVDETAKVWLRAQSNGTYAITTKLSFDNIGEIIGELAENEFAKGNTDKDIIWTGYTIAGTFEVEVVFDPAEKTVSYDITFYDENGVAVHGDKEIEKYATDKAIEAAKLVGSQRLSDDEKDTEVIQKAEQKIRDRIAYVRSIVDQIASASFSATADTAEELYSKIPFDQYLAKVDDKLDKDVSGKVEDKIPASIDEILNNEKVTDVYDILVEQANAIIGDIATIDFTPADAAEILKSGYNFDFRVRTGPDAYCSFWIDDDQEDELLAAVVALDKEPVDYANAGYTVVLEDGSTPDFENKEYEFKQIDSEKRITADVSTVYGVYGQLFYDVEREIVKIVVVPVEETTTTTTTTTGSSKPTSSSDDASTTTTTVTEPTGSDSGSSQTTTVTDPTGTGSDSGSSQTTTVTDPTGTGSDSGSSQTTTVTDPTGTGSDSGSSDTTTSTDPSGSTTTTTAATYISFEIKGVSDNGLIYWSEEKTAFDLSDLSITMHFIEAGQDTGKTVDVTKAFETDADSSDDLSLADGLGFAATPINFVLKDAESVQKAVLDAGYGQDLIDQEKLIAGKQVGSFNVYLVLRGDSDLNGIVDVVDAQYALVYYTETIMAQLSAKTILNDADCIYLLEKGDKRETYFPYSHYAMDVTFDSKNLDATQNNGIVSVEDAQQILNYYTVFVVGEKTGTWNHTEVITRDITVLEDLHAEPLKYDTAASDYVFNAAEQ